MPRQIVPNSGTLFLTQVTWRRFPLFADPAHVDLLLARLRETKERHPFHMRAWVILPDHLHLIVDPVGETSPGALMGHLKATFTIAYREMKQLPTGLMLWQKGYYAHAIAAQLDLHRHIDYIHYNPVRHRLVDKPEEWPHTSFHWWHTHGHYEAEWGWSAMPSWVDALAAHAEGAVDEAPTDS